MNAVPLSSASDQDGSPQDRLVRAATLRCGALVEPGGSFTEKPLVAAFLKAVRLAEPGSSGGPESVPIPGWNPQPGQTDIVVRSPNFDGRLLFEAKVDDINQMLWDLFKMLSGSRVDDVQGVYLLGAARIVNSPGLSFPRWAGGRACAPLFDESSDGRVWGTEQMLADWKGAWEALLRDGTARPSRVPEKIKVSFIGSSPVPAFAGHEIRCIRVSAEGGRWLEMEDGRLPPPSSRPRSPMPAGLGERADGPEAQSRRRWQPAAMTGPPEGTVEPAGRAGRGHVFVIRGDVTRIDCDAWLCPTDRAMRIEEWWGVSPTEQPEGWGHRLRAVAAPLREGPLPILTDVGGTVSEPAGWYREGVRAFLEVAMGTISAPRHGRERPLLALPVVGTGKGGARDRRGEMTSAVIEELLAWTADGSADAVLVCQTDRALAAAQAVRRRLEHERGDRALWDLDVGLVSESRRLARAARDGQLVLFLGAGIGSGAGLPGWGELLDQLAVDAGLADKLEALRDIPSPMDRAAIVGNHLDRPVGEAVADRITGADRVSLAHAILAGLPVRESATTNYDRLFERACAEAGREIAVLPYQDARAGRDGWLLKMHGSVDHPEDIVLTRADYLSYGSERAALRGLVQALLITRHMLFVGFSLSDENFHQVVHDVRQAIRTRAGGPAGEFGTALMLFADPLAQELWRGDLRLVATGAADSEGAAARRLEIFLDHALAHATDNTPHLLDPTYEGLLGPEEESLAAALRELGARAAGHDSLGWDQVRAFLRDRGWDASLDR